MSAKFISGSVKVVTAGTRVQISTQHLIVSQLFLYNASGNGAVVGGSDVTADLANLKGVLIPSPQPICMQNQKPGFAQGIDLFDVWVDSTQDNEVIGYLAII